MRRSIRFASLLNFVVVGACAVAGCSGDSRHTTPASDLENSGSIGLALQAPGVVLNTVTYTITGPHTYSGTIDVSSSSSLTFFVGGIAPGTGYVLTINATDTDGGATCTGDSAPFAVAANATTTVLVGLVCKQTHKNGSISVNGTLNVCPALMSVNSTPPMGNVIALSSAVADPDNGPSPISYLWTASTGRVDGAVFGTLSSTTVPNPTLTCAVPGPVSLTLTIGDGDPGCEETSNLSVICPDDAAVVDSAWVELGPSGQISARLITHYTGCPVITVDGVARGMNVRSRPATEPLRPTQNDPVVNPASTTSKPSVFPVTSCEGDVPPGTTSLSAAGKRLPLPKTDVQRVMIVGDTGCRLAIGNAIQNCNDPTQYPFPVIAQAAAAMHPDLVLHVGDYHYREIACPPDTLGCAGSPWGYGYDVWAADFFTPAAPLLAAAPWVMVRGNHESCTRGGQGWYRFLDPLPYAAGRSCTDPADDNNAAYNEPYAVAFGDTQFVVFDSSAVGKAALTPATKPADVLPFNMYQTEIQNAGVFTSNMDMLSIFTNHHPLLGFTAGSPVTGGNPALLSVMSATYPNAYYPPGVGMALHGHVHDFQAVNFASGHPATIVAGIGGDNLDVALPDPFPTTTVPAAAGTVLDKITYSNTFGFLIMDRVGAKQWKFTAFRRDGSIMTVCDMVTTPFMGSGSPTPGRQITCSTNGNIP